MLQYVKTERSGDHSPVYRCRLGHAPLDQFGHKRRDFCGRLGLRRRGQGRGLLYKPDRPLPAINAVVAVFPADRAEETAGLKLSNRGLELLFDFASVARVSSA